MSLSIKDSITPGLARLASKFQDKKPILEAMGTEMAAIANGSFNNASLRAAPWAPLKASTIREKIRLGRNSGIMKRSLVLMRSFTPSSYTTSTVTVSTDRPQAPYLQFGTRRGLPVRPMLPFIGGPDSAKLAPFAREKIQKIAQAKMDSLLKQSAG